MVVHSKAWGAEWLRDRVLGKVTLHEGCTIASIGVSNGAVDVTLSSGHRIRADHVILATGYQVDLGRLPMIDPALRARIKTHKGSPVLSDSFETTVPGLYFVGVSAWRAEDDVVDQGEDNHRHDDVEKDQPPAHPVSHLSPLLSCGQLQLHGLDYYHDSINDFLDDGRRAPDTRPHRGSDRPSCWVPNAWAFPSVGVSGQPGGKLTPRTRGEMRAMSIADGTNRTYPIPAYLIHAPAFQ